LKREAEFSLIDDTEKRPLMQVTSALSHYRPSSSSRASEAIHRSVEKKEGSCIASTCANARHSRGARNDGDGLGVWFQKFFAALILKKRLPAFCLKKSWMPAFAGMMGGAVQTSHHAGGRDGDGVVGRSASKD